MNLKGKKSCLWVNSLFNDVGLTDRFIESSDFIKLGKIVTIGLFSMCLINPDVSANDTSSNVREVQQSPQKITVKGIVKDKMGEIPSVAVTIKGDAVMGTITQVDGTFTLTNVPSNATLVFSYLGYETQEVNLKKLSKDKYQNLIIMMKEDSKTLDEVVIAGAVAQKKVSLVGAITTLEPAELKSPTRSLTNQLAGRVAGVTFVQNSGQPGKDGASFIIRGINSVTGNTEPLILIDGLKRDIDDVDPNDIESFSVLKDASATAVYGLEGANGIIVIKTKSGNVGSRPHVRVSYNMSLNGMLHKPKWVDAPTYAKMRNEAYVVRGKKPLYSDEILAKFADDNMDMYPNVDWYDKLISNSNFGHKANFNISGGSSTVSYYLSGGFYSEKGMFQTSKDANSNYSQFNFRSNTKADISPTTTLAIGFDGRYNTTTEPGQSVNSILGVMNNVNPTLFPHEYSNGTAPEEPSGVTNPYSLLNKTGFIKDYENIMSTNLNFTQKLDFVTPGLFVNFIASFSKNNYNRHKYVKAYQQHGIDYVNSYMGTGYDEEGNLMTINRTPDLDDKMKFETSPATGNRVVEVQASVNYSRTFAKKWNLSGLILYKQREYMTDSPQGDQATLLINALKAREQSIAGRASLDYNHKYFLDINAGFSGSQLFTPSNRWSSFPSFGAGWLLSGEDFWMSSGLSNVIDLFKLKATIGFVGAPGNATRFGYLPTVKDYPGFTFGYGAAAGSGKYVPGIGEDRLEQLGLTWEKNRKVNCGFELGLFDQFKVIFEYYNYRNKHQLIDLTNLPGSLGLSSYPKANRGETVSKGYDIDFTYSKKINNFKINYIKGIISYSTNKIIENGELNPKVPYQSGIGLDWGRSMNYIALGLFKDQNEIDSSPVQTWSKVMPGDIKYKDIDGDGVITPQDRIYLGNVYPKWSYSLAMDFEYRNFIFATRFIGKADMFRTINGGRIPFNSTNESGAIYQAAVDDHWTPESYSGNPLTENPNAEYPRLAYGADNLNNVQQSTFWLRDASYIRWADIELGYNYMPKDKIRGVKNIYFYGRIDNVATFSKFKDWDPEQMSSVAYPLKRTFTLGFEIGLNL